MPMKGPSPMMASHPNRTAASTPTFTFALPMTERRYSSGCSKKAGKQGIDTTRAATPFSFSCACAATAIDTSEPEAKIDTSACPDAGEIS